MDMELYEEAIYNLKKALEYTEGGDRDIQDEIQQAEVPPPKKQI